MFLPRFVSHTQRQVTDHRDGDNVAVGIIDGFVDWSLVYEILENAMAVPRATGVKEEQTYRR